MHGAYMNHANPCENIPGDGPSMEFKRTMYEPWNHTACHHYKLLGFNTSTEMLGLTVTKNFGSLVLHNVFRFLDGHQFKKGNTKTLFKFSVKTKEWFLDFND